MVSLQIFEKHRMWSNLSFGSDFIHPWEKMFNTIGICGFFKASLEILFTGTTWVWNEWADTNDWLESIFYQNRITISGLLDVIWKKDDFPH